MITIGDEPLHVLTIMDSEMQRITLVTIGQQEALRQKMREISEVLHVSGDTVDVDMSKAMGGYPMIKHQQVSLQVIPYQEFLEGEEACGVTDFVATGGHLES